MPDYSFCTNWECPFKGSCKRQTEKPNERQSYTKFELEEDGSCKYYMPKKEHLTDEF